MTTTIADPIITYPTIPISLFLQDSLAGTAAGWAQVFVGHPFDTIKVQLQTQSSPPKYSGAVDCLKVTVREEGARALYKGVGSPLLGIGICNAVLFSANGNFRRMLSIGKENKVLSIPEIGVAGAASGFVMAFINCPVELFKVMVQVSAKKSVESSEPKIKGVRQAALETFRQRGMKGFYRGIGITIVRDVPSFAAYFMTYETIKRYLASTKTSLTNTDLIIAGGLAGIGAWIPCYPQDVIKSQIQGFGYPTITSAARAVLKNSNGSWMGFWKGFLPTMMRAFPANAATFFTYEMVLQLMR